MRAREQTGGKVKCNSINLVSRKEWYGAKAQKREATTLLFYPRGGQARRCDNAGAETGAVYIGMYTAAQKAATSSWTHAEVSHPQARGRICRWLHGGCLNRDDGIVERFFMEQPK